MVIRVDALRLAYMAVPKCASSTVKRALAELDPDVDTENLIAPSDHSSSRWHKVYPTSRFRPHRWETVPDEWFGFTVVRDPLDRLLACYTNRVVERRELHNSPKLRDGIIDLPKDPDADFFFQNLQAYREASSVVKHHSMHIWLFTGPKLEKFKRVYTVEALSKLQDDLADWIQTPVHFHRENTSSVPLTADDLSGDTHEALSDWLQQEYDFLSDFYARP